MQLGLYTSCFHDRSLDEALDAAVEAGVTSIEVCTGGFLSAPHVWMEALLVSEREREEYLARFRDRGLTLTALNVNGNPIHPDPDVRGTHRRDLYDTIRLAELLEVENVVAMSGTPGADASATTPSWVTVYPWDSSYTDVLDYQWDEVAVPFWKDVDKAASSAGVRIALECHPHMLVYNPGTLERLLVQTDAEALGCEMDPSHLFWQGADPLHAIERFGDRVFNAAAKDTRINEEAVRKNGLIENDWSTLEDPFPIGGDYVLRGRGPEPAWEFVAPGRGHDVEFWADWIRSLNKIDPDMPVNIENEDGELGPEDGFTHAVETLRAAEESL